MNMAPTHSVVAIVPCNDLDESQAFYEKLGFLATARYDAHGYRILHDSQGASIHLTQAPPGWVIPGQNSHGLYLYSANLEELARTFGCNAQAKPWGLREFAVSDPNGTLVRVGWP
jgi:catechol 2,3-dioxygenase-like lactoylglutathione lyase family enzyme